MPISFFVAVAVAVAGGPWNAGWGFAPHHGVPPMQPFLQSYHLNKSVTTPLFAKCSAFLGESHYFFFLQTRHSIRVQSSSLCVEGAFTLLSHLFSSFCKRAQNISHA